MNLTKFSKANLPNLRRLFVEARTDAEESAYSRNAVSVSHFCNYSNAHCFIALVLQYRPFHVIGCRLQPRGSANEQDRVMFNTPVLLF